MATDFKGDMPEKAEERASLDRARADKIPGVTEEQKAHFLHFANKDEEWIKQFDKKLLRKVDAHLMPTITLM